MQYNDLGELEKIIEKESENISCLIMEPVLANYGLLIPEKNYSNGN